MLSQERRSTTTTQQAKINGRPGVGAACVDGGGGGGNDQMGLGAFFLRSLPVTVSWCVCVCLCELSMRVYLLSIQSSARPQSSLMRSS